MLSSPRTLRFLALALGFVALVAGTSLVAFRDNLAMAARIRPRADGGRKPRPGPYDHLARTDEWTLTAGVDDP